MRRVDRRIALLTAGLVACAAAPDEIDPNADLADALFDQLQKTGGFSISGPEVLRRLAESDGEAPDADPDE